MVLENKEKKGVVMYILVAYFKLPAKLQEKYVNSLRELVIP